MAILIHEASGRSHTLAARCLIGRARYAQVRSEANQVSAEHASVRWTGSGWVLRDLGSRNGTFVDGRRLEAGQVVPLTTGCQLAFGDLVDPWTLTEDGPPEVAAVRLDSQERRVAQHGMLALPDDASAELTLIASAGGGWQVEDAEGQREIRDGEVVLAGGQPWRVLLPVIPDATHEGASWQPSVSDLSLHFVVSRDEEEVQVELSWMGGSARLKPRAHHYALLTLARLRLQDAELPESERGWVYQDELARMLGLTANHLNVSIYRLRKEVAACDILDPASLIERRPVGRQVRIGVQRLSVEQP